MCRELSFILLGPDVNAKKKLLACTHCRKIHDFSRFFIWNLIITSLRIQFLRVFFLVRVGMIRS